MYIWHRNGINRNEAVISIDILKCDRTIDAFSIA